MTVQYASLGHLTVTKREGEPPQIMLLGYSLLLSPSETAILLAILDAEGGKALSSAELAARLSVDDSAVSPEQVSVLVYRINRKASAISGRRLIAGVSRHGFRLETYM